MPLLYIYRARVGRVLTRDTMKKGGFSRTVDTDDADAVAVVHREGYVLQNDVRAEREGILL